MSDRLLRELGDLARSETKAEEARFDDRWDRLAAGTLTAEEEAELKALAESSPEIREAYQAFQPLGADFQARVLSRINAQPPKPAPAPAPRPEPPKPPPPVSLFWRVVRRPEVRAGFAAAGAAGVLILMWPPTRPPLNLQVTEFSGGVNESRGNEPKSSGLPVFVPGAPLTFAVTTASYVQGVEARVLLSPLSGTRNLRPLEPEPHLEITDQGAVRLQGTLGQEIHIPPGDWRIWIVVGRKGKIPSIKDLQAELSSGRMRHAAWEAVSKDLRVAARASP